MKKYFTSLGLVLCILAADANGHLDKTSLSIKGGESFISQAMVTITWKIAVMHMKPNYVYFSPDSQTGWQLIDSVAEKSGTMQMSYSWKVPQIATSKARIRIFQSLPSKPSEFTDDYTLVSKPFTIRYASETFVGNNRAAPSVNGAANKKAGLSFSVNGRSIGMHGEQKTAYRRFVSQVIVAR